MNSLLDLVHIDRSHSLNGTAYHEDSILLVVVGFEMIFNIGLLLIHPLYCYIVMKSNVVHRNVRLQLCTAVTVFSMGILARFYLFFCQYTVVPDAEVVYPHMAGEMLRDFSRTLAVSLITSFAIERTVATYAWKWYEKTSWTTLSVFIVTESFNLSTVILNEVFKYTISVSACFYFMVLVEVCGLIAFLHIFRQNIKLKHRIETENEIYSVAHKFQVQENVEVLRLMLRIVKAWVLFVTLSFMSYGFFVFGPNDLVLSRNISYCVFELLTALHYSTFYYLSITGNTYIRKQFCTLFPCLQRMNTVNHAGLQRDQISETAKYFADLRRHWN